MSQTQTINPNQVNTSIFGMASAVFTSICGALVTVAVRSNELIDKSANTLIYSVGAAENVAHAVEQRSKIYGDGIVKNGALAERETELKHRLRLLNLERQEEAVRAGTANYTPDPTMKERAASAMKAAKEAVVGTGYATNNTAPKITPAVPA